MSDMTHVVIHPKLNMLVNGKTEPLKVGTELKLTGAKAKLLGSKVKEIKTAKKVDIVESEAKAKAKAEAKAKSDAAKDK